MVAVASVNETLPSLSFLSSSGFLAIVPSTSARLTSTFLNKDSPWIHLIYYHPLFIVLLYQIFNTSIRLTCIKEIWLWVYQMGRILLQTKLSCFLILFELSKIGLKIYHQKQYNCFHTLYRLRLEKQ
jgi:hypothetical protein